MQGMTILVTGAAGFVGLNVVEHLLRAGRSVAGLDRIDLPPRARRLFPSLPGSLTWTSGSVQSASDLSRALTAAPVQAVIHCAVITAGAERERRDPEGIVATNVGGATATLAAAARHGVGRFIYPSSVAVYGTAARGVDLVREDEVPPRPVMLYGLTKLACEILLPRVAEVGGIGFAAARLASVYGPWDVCHRRARHAVTDAVRPAARPRRDGGGAGTPWPGRLHLCPGCRGRAGGAGGRPGAKANNL
jgi:nucleoside-diphosphate-sugar epimerase